MTKEFGLFGGFGECDVFGLFGCSVVQLFSCLVVWLFGCLVVWLFGCLIRLFAFLFFCSVCSIVVRFVRFVCLGLFVRFLLFLCIDFVVNDVVGNFHSFVVVGKGGFDVRCPGAVVIWIERWEFLVRIGFGRCVSVIWVWLFG